MKVKELIELLEHQNPNLEVVTRISGDEFSCVDLVSEDLLILTEDNVWEDGYMEGYEEQEVVRLYTTVDRF